MDIDIPKYIKRKKSSKSKAKEKANHKHIYKECLFVVDNDSTPHKGTYCTICGKIGNVNNPRLKSWACKKLYVL